MEVEINVVLDTDTREYLRTRVNRVKATRQTTGKIRREAKSANGDVIGALIRYMRKNPELEVAISAEAVGFDD